MTLPTMTTWRNAALQELKAKGVQINEVSELAAFRQLMPPVYQAAAGAIGSDTIQAIQNPAESAH